MKNPFIAFIVLVLVGLVLLATEPGGMEKIYSAGNQYAEFFGAKEFSSENMVMELPGKVKIGGQTVTGSIRDILKQALERQQQSVEIIYITVDGTPVPIPKDPQQAVSTDKPSSSTKTAVKPTATLAKNNGSKSNADQALDAPNGGKTSTGAVSIFPPGVTYYWFTYPWGGQFHDSCETGRYVCGPIKGYDYMVPKGTPIYSPVAGVVIRDTPDGIGNSVIVIHFTWNGHKMEAGFLHQVNVLKKGQNVKVGDLVGYVDKIGNANPEHLHLWFRNLETGELLTNHHQFVK